MDVLIWHSQSQEQKRHKMGLKKFQIILPYPTKTYIPGETVAGQLQIELDDTKKKETTQEHAVMHTGVGP